MTRQTSHLRQYAHLARTYGSDRPKGKGIMLPMLLIVITALAIIIVILNREPVYNTCSELKDHANARFKRSSGKYTTGGMGPYLENRGLQHEKYMHKYFDQYAHGNAVDVGANCGFHTRELCKRCDSVLAVEPGTTTIQYLRENAPSARVLNKALGKDIGTATLACGENKSLCKLSRKGTTVEVDTLDNVMQDTRLDFLKVDVEGREADVIRGGMNTITRDKPTIIYESNLFSKDEVKDILTSIGYDVKAISARDRLALPRR